MQLTLAYIGLSFFQGNVASLQFSVLAIVPLGFWAQYRARRYILSRTRWRGIRFGVSPGAWGYALRAMLWWLAVIVSLGLLYPAMQLSLARYTTDRSFFGDLRFEQRGGWGPLFAGFFGLWFTVFLIIAFLIALFAMNEMAAPPAWFQSLKAWAMRPTSAVAMTGIAVLAFIWLAFLRLRYETFAFCYINSNKWLGGETRLEMTLSPWTVLGIYIGGSVMMMVVVMVVSIIVSIILVIFAFIFGAGMADFEALDPSTIESYLNSGAIAALIIPIAIYFCFIAMGVALSHMFWIQPILRAVINSSKLFNAEAAAMAKQRAHDDQIEAGGFADALGADIGGV